MQYIVNIVLSDTHIVCVGASLCLKININKRLIEGLGSRWERITSILNCLIMRNLPDFYFFYCNLDYPEKTTHQPYLFIGVRDQFIVVSLFQNVLIHNHIIVFLCISSFIRFLLFISMSISADTFISLLNSISS